MSAPAAVLSQLADLAVDGATVAALVLVALDGLSRIRFPPGEKTAYRMATGSGLTFA